MMFLAKKQMTRYRLTTCILFTLFATQGHADRQDDEKTAGMVVGGTLGGVATAVSPLNPISPLSPTNPINRYSRYTATQRNTATATQQKTTSVTKTTSGEGEKLVTGVLKQPKKKHGKPPKKPPNTEQDLRKVEDIASDADKVVDDAEKLE